MQQLVPDPTFMDLGGRSLEAVGYAAFGIDAHVRFHAEEQGVAPLRERYLAIADPRFVSTALPITPSGAASAWHKGQPHCPYRSEGEFVCQPLLMICPWRTCYTRIAYFFTRDNAALYVRNSVC